MCIHTVMIILLLECATTLIRICQRTAGCHVLEFSNPCLDAAILSALFSAIASYNLLYVYAGH